jgi:hypothetical protein
MNVDLHYINHPSLLNLFWLIGNVYHSTLQECGISTQAGKTHKGGVKNVCLNNTASARVHNIKIFLVNKEAYK